MDLITRGRDRTVTMFTSPRRIYGCRWREGQRRYCRCRGTGGPTAGNRPDGQDGTSSKPKRRDAVWAQEELEAAAFDRG